MLMFAKTFQNVIGAIGLCAAPASGASWPRGAAKCGQEAAKMVLINIIIMLFACFNYFLFHMTVYLFLSLGSDSHRI